jgi:hypothetical protein
MKTKSIVEGLIIATFVLAAFLPGGTENLEPMR